MTIREDCTAEERVEKVPEKTVAAKAEKAAAKAEKESKKAAAAPDTLDMASGDTTDVASETIYKHLPSVSESLFV